MGKISDEIRMFVKRSYADEHMDPKELLALAERIDSELVELPRDADGVPIHVGDTVYLNEGREAKVFRVNIASDNSSIDFTTCCDGRIYNAIGPTYFTHTRPDSLERIADELEELSESNRVNGSGEVFYRAGDLAARIRRLADKEGK